MDSKTRREFLKSTGRIAAAGAVLAGPFMAPTRAAAQTTASTIELPPLPYAQDALQPHISPETISFHYGKHHRSYVDKLNGLLKDSPLAGKSLEEIVLQSDGSLFNNAAQVWNHTFYWHSMKPGGGKPDGELASAIDRDFGSLDKCKEALTKAATTQFGSGWAWLIFDQGKLGVMSTGNADLPMKTNRKALLAVDVWEHAYYIDYRNDRAKYVAAVIDSLLNWTFAAENFAKAKSA